jgi:hypothetical protein
VGDDELQVAGCRLQVYPNPSSGAVRLRLVNSEQGLVILDLFNISGQKIRRLLNQERMPGTCEMEVEMSDLQSGVYFLKLEVDGLVETEKIILLTNP